MVSRFSHIQSLSLYRIYFSFSTLSNIYACVYIYTYYIPDQAHESMSKFASAYALGEKESKAAVNLLQHIPKLVKEGLIELVRFLNPTIMFFCETTFVKFLHERNSSRICLAIGNVEITQAAWTAEVHYPRSSGRQPDESEPFHSFRVSVAMEECAHKLRPVGGAYATSHGEGFLGTGTQNEKNLELQRIGNLILTLLLFRFIFETIYGFIFWLHINSQTLP